MKRWLVWFLLPLLTCVSILAHRAYGPGLLADTDTSVLLQALRQRNSPLSWWSTDWPLGNHFFRPVSTLFFEMDERFHSGNAAGFGLTNALLACSCVLLLFWLVREVIEIPWVAGLSSAVFGIWHVTGYVPEWLTNSLWGLATLSLIGIVRGGWKSVPSVCLSFFSICFLSQVVGPVSPFGPRIIGWLPGRTASTMSLFFLLSLAAYMRYERLRPSAKRATEQATALDVPATKGTQVLTILPTNHCWIWAAFSLVSLALALGCYEQAVMLPASFVALGVFLKTQGRVPDWRPQVLSWMILGAYLAWRSHVVPNAPSGYQLQQFRNGPGVLISLFDYALPLGNWFGSFVITMSGGLILLLMPTPWISLTLMIGNILSWVIVKLDKFRWTVLLFFVLSVVSFLPMAWLQPFGHYHYLPSAFRAVFVVLLASASFKAFANAVSLPPVQAPKRLRPAPGSLLRQ